MPFADPAGAWSRRFAGNDYLFGFEPNAWLREHASVWSPGDRVPCVADGEGRNSVWLTGKGLTVDAFDVAEVGVAKARRVALERGVTVNFAVTDCDAYPWPEAVYDGVAAIFVQFADPAMRGRLFAHIVRSLKPGGPGYCRAIAIHRSNSTTARAGRRWRRICTPRPCCARPSLISTWSCCVSTRPTLPRAAVIAATRH